MISPDYKQNSMCVYVCLRRGSLNFWTASQWIQLHKRPSITALKKLLIRNSTSSFPTFIFLETDWILSLKPTRNFYMKFIFTSFNVSYLVKPLVWSSASQIVVLLYLFLLLLKGISCFQILAIVNKVAININVLVLCEHVFNSFG